MKSPDVTYGLIINTGDIDSLGHLHYTRYADYFDEGRRLLQGMYEISDSQLAQQGLELVVCEWNVRHFGEVFADAHIKVHSKLEASGRAAFFIKQEMEADGEVVASEEIINAFTKRKNGKRIPTRPPAEFIERLKNRRADSIL